MLKWIWHEAVFQPYPGFAPMAQPLVSQQVVHQTIKIRVMGKEDVAADIPRESERIGEGTGKAAGMGRRVGEKIVMEAQLAKPMDDSQAGRTGADNQDLSFVQPWFRPHCAGLPALGRAIDFDPYAAAWRDPASRTIVPKDTKPDGDHIRSKLENTPKSTHGNPVFGERHGVRRHATRCAPFCQ
jgi:hypothetical protein